MDAVLTEEEERKERLAKAKEFIRQLEERAATAFQEGFQQGFQQGYQQGYQQAQSLLHVAERKLGRPVSEEERAIIRARFGTLGPERVSDVVFNLPPSELGTWLADPAAR